MTGSNYHQKGFSFNPRSDKHARTTCTVSVSDGGLQLAPTIKWHNSHFRASELSGAFMQQKHVTKSKKYRGLLGFYKPEVSGEANHWVTGIDQEAPANKSPSLSPMGAVISIRMTNVCSVIKRGVYLAPREPNYRTSSHLWIEDLHERLTLIYGRIWWRSNLGFNKCGYKGQKV